MEINILSTKSSLNQTGRKIHLLTYQYLPLIPRPSQSVSLDLELQDVQSHNKYPGVT